MSAKKRPEPRPLREIEDDAKNFFLWFDNSWFFCFMSCGHVYGSNGKRNLCIVINEVKNNPAFPASVEDVLRENASYTDEDIISLALECGFVISPGENQPCAVGTKSILRFANALLTGQRPMLDLPKRSVRHD